MEMRQDRGKCVCVCVVGSVCTDVYASVYDCVLVSRCVCDVHRKREGKRGKEREREGD